MELNYDCFIFNRRHVVDRWGVVELNWETKPRRGHRSLPLSHRSWCLCKQKHKTLLQSLQDNFKRRRKQQRANKQKDKHRFPKISFAPASHGAIWYVINREKEAPPGSLKKRHFMAHNNGFLWHTPLCLPRTKIGVSV